MNRFFLMFIVNSVLLFIIYRFVELISELFFFLTDSV